jgi:hypothetical protein
LIGSTGFFLYSLNEGKKKGVRWGEGFGRGGGGKGGYSEKPSCYIVNRPSIPKLCMAGKNALENRIIRQGFICG